MEFFRPTSLVEACALKAERPELVPIAGGTDLMVALNFGRERPRGLLDLTGVDELRALCDDGDTLRVGAGVSYTRITAELAGPAPALAGAARAVGSPQIRNRGTLGGNLATASPAGDGLPPLLATGGSVELASAAGTREVPVGEFCTGPKRSVLAPDELVVAVRFPARRGPQHFAKIGTRNAMVISVASVAVALDTGARRVGVGLGAVAPTPIGSPEFADAALDWDGRAPLEPGAAARFGELVARAAAPIDDVRGTADYRRHALRVLTARCLNWVWDDYRRIDECA
ncbi:FAD binding domain-containing protein [Pseudonocardia acaciae]|uniref:FAD binding domain-containing protein n=1 Tax=Pseudonocardia acaciae TaxID=551276 RepID=UPI00048E9406|nr:xanthine dehydrogenase family protein subunit M [Pseudonocardia acaciae]